MLPTPSASDGDRGGPNRPENRLAAGHQVQLIDLGLSDQREVWGRYEPAVRRWEELTRPAPSPVEPNTKGEPRLSARFAEWMMGWPEGWVDVEGLSRRAQLRICGNGVVPQQAAGTLRLLLADLGQELKDGGN